MRHSWQAGVGQPLPDGAASDEAARGSPQRTRATDLDQDADVLDDEVIFLGLPVEYLENKTLLGMPGVTEVETAHNPAAYEAFEINIEEFLAD